MIFTVYKQVFSYLTFANHRTKESFVSTANQRQVGILGDVTASVAVTKNPFFPFDHREFQDLLKWNNKYINVWFSFHPNGGHVELVTWCTNCQPSFCITNAPISKTLHAFEREDLSELDIFTSEVKKDAWTVCVVHAIFTRRSGNLSASEAYLTKNLHKSTTTTTTKFY